MNVRHGRVAFASLLRQGLQHRSYVLAMGLATGLGIVKLLIFAQSLNVDAFGQLSLALVLMAPLSYLLGLGLEPTFLRDGSLLAGQGELGKVVALRNATVSMACFIGLLLVTLWISARFCGGTLYWCSEVALCAGVMLAFNLVSTYYRVIAKTQTFVGLLVLRQMLALGLGLLWIRLGWSLVLSEALSYTVALALSLMVERVQWQPPRLSLLKRSLSLGLPMSLSALVLNAAVSGDRWVLPQFISAHEYGLYSFAMIAFTIGCGILNFITPIIIPSWLRRYGRTGSAAGLFRDMLRFTLSVLVLGAVCVTILLGLLYAVKEIAMPKYLPAFPYICVISYGTLLHMANLWPTFLLTLERSGETLAWQAIVLLLQLLSLVICSGFNCGLVGFTLVFVLGRLVSLCVLMLRAFSLARQPSEGPAPDVQTA